MIILWLFSTRFVKLDWDALTLGKNAQWKAEIDLGKQINQNFVSIPHSRLIEMLEYKARLAGINVILQEESYTSRANFVGLDPIPVYGKTEKEPMFTGNTNFLNICYR